MIDYNQFIKEKDNMATNTGDLIASNTQGRFLSEVSEIVPYLVQNSGEGATHKFIEYFVGQIRNPNTRSAYAQSVRQFFSWCETKGMSRLEDVSYLAVAAYIEQHPGSPTTVSQHLAAIRQLFAWLVGQRILESNPAEHVKGPKLRIKIGKTPVLEAAEMHQLLHGIDTSHITGLRDLALISVMTFTFARISAALAMDIKDYFPKGSRRWVCLHEKGGKYLEVPLHHTAEEYMHSYVEALQEQCGELQKDTPLFRSQQRGRARVLSDRRLNRRDALAMVKRRAIEVG